MKDKRILYVSSEVLPYLPQNEVSQASFDAPKTINDLGGETRIFMPRYGAINERRHQLHEVIRLSGMNLVVNDVDMPLVIKVASIPKERIQVYFIDNEDYFKRKGLFKDENEELFEDNDERAIFFAKGVIETVKKLNWIPDVIHVNGWLSALVPLYIKNYGGDSIFADTKIVTSIFPTSFEDCLSEGMYDKLAFDEFDEELIEDFKKPSFVNIMKNAIRFSDGVVIASDEIDNTLKKYIKSSKKPMIQYSSNDEMCNQLSDFYKTKL